MVHRRNKSVFSIRNLVDWIKRKIFGDEPDCIAYCSMFCHRNTLHKFIKRKKYYIILKCY